MSVGFCLVSLNTFPEGEVSVAIPSTRSIIAALFLAIGLRVSGRAESKIVGGVKFCKLISVGIAGTGVMVVRISAEIAGVVEEVKEELDGSTGRITKAR